MAEIARLPSMRPKLLREVEALARTHTGRAIDVLVEIMEDGEASSAARVSAAQTILDRGWGKARQIVQVDVGPESLSDDQLKREIEQRFRALLEQDHLPDSLLPPTGPSLAAGVQRPSIDGVAERADEEGDEDGPHRLRDGDDE